MRKKITKTLMNKNYSNNLINDNLDLLAQTNSYLMEKYTECQVLTP